MATSAWKRISDFNEIIFEPLQKRGRLTFLHSASDNSHQMVHRGRSRPRSGRHCIKTDLSIGKAARQKLDQNPLLHFFMQDK